jgi:hypothetical protein
MACSTATAPRLLQAGRQHGAESAPFGLGIDPLDPAAPPHHGFSLARLPDHPVGRIPELLPWTWKPQTWQLSRPNPHYTGLSPDAYATRVRPANFRL